MADTQKSSSFCLLLCGGPDSFLEHPDGRPHLGFHNTPEDASRNLRAYVTTPLGALRCRTAVQLADGRGMLLKYVSSYVTKMHEAATVNDLYCCDVSGYQAANSFLRSVRPLAPEMAFQLSNIKVAVEQQTHQAVPGSPAGLGGRKRGLSIVLKKGISVRNVYRFCSGCAGTPQRVPRSRTWEATSTWWR